MLLTKERITRQLGDLNDTQLQMVADYVLFLKFQERIRPRLVYADAELRTMYAESADEDRLLAEADIAEYKAALENEDNL